MKKLLIFSVLCSLSYCNQIEPKLYFPSSEILLEDVKLDHDQEVTFEFINKGMNPLIIENVHSSCKCLISNFPRKKIYHNERGAIKLL